MNIVERVIELKYKYLWKMNTENMRQGFCMECNEIPIVKDLGAIFIDVTTDEEVDKGGMDFMIKYKDKEIDLIAFSDVCDRELRKRKLNKIARSR